MDLSLPSISIFLTFLLFFSLASPSLSLNSLSPPAGNSLALKVKTLNGVQLYRCADGDWIAESASATLVDIAGSGTVLGRYSLVQNPRIPRFVGTWTLLNNAGESAESGFSYSVVGGKQVASVKSASQQDLPDFLALASMHQNDGAASLVSYIARVNTKYGMPRDNDYCASDNKVIKVPFDAEFQFWKQDLIPPSTPQVLAVESDRPIQGFFGSGVVTYGFDGLKWKQRSILATLYDIPGGSVLGSYFTRSVPDNKGGSFCWQVNNPNGFQIVGKNACKPVLVVPGCLPWSLNVVTTSSGNSSIFGPYTHVQTVSTTGGVPPISPLLKAQYGQVWKADFTAIYWFYSRN